MKEVGPDKEASSMCPGESGFGVTFGHLKSHRGEV